MNFRKKVMLAVMLSATVSSAVVPSINEAKFGVGIIASAEASVHKMGISEIGVGEVVSLSVDGFDAGDLHWKSTDKYVAPVSNGVVTGIEMGEAVIIAEDSDGNTYRFTFYVTDKPVTVKQNENKTDDKKESKTENKKDSKSEDKSSSKKEVKKIGLNYSKINLYEGDEKTLTAKTSPADAETKLTWTTSDSSIATVENGVVTGINEGTATITVKTSNGLTKECTVVVHKKNIKPDGIEVVGDEMIELMAGMTYTPSVEVTPFDATDKTVTWSSANDDIASVDENGTITANAKGAVVITARTVNGKKAKFKVRVSSLVTSITVPQDMISLAVGKKAKVDATVETADGLKGKVVYISDNDAVASVDSKGNITANSAGVANIFVTSSNGLTASMTVSVEEFQSVNAIILDRQTAEMTYMDTLELKATVSPEDAVDKTVTWSSSDTSVAKVKDGVVTAVKPGAVTITARAASGLKAECQIIVTDTKEPITINTNLIEIDIGQTYQLKATVPQSKKNKKLYYGIVNPDIATIDANGFVTAKQNGFTRIKIRDDEGNVVTCDLRVKACRFDEDKIKMKLGEEKKLVFYGYIKNIRSSDETILKVDKQGNVIAIAPGKAQIIITDICGNKAMCNITVE